MKRKQGLMTGSPPALAVFMHVRMKRKIGLMVGPTLALVVFISILFFQIALSQATPTPITPLDPTTVPKFTDQLVVPPAYSPTVVTDPVTGQTRHEYTISMEQFQQQILPAGYPLTTVFGYKGMVASPGGPILFQNSPSATFEAVKGIPVKVNWVNNLTNQILPVDPTIMWADPNNMGMPMAPFNPYPPGYPQAQSPVPAVTHLHGGEDRSDSDGGPEAWVTSTGLAGPTLGANHTAPNTATFTYPNGQLPTTLWYHDHALGLTRINVLSGLAGFYLLRDPADPIAASLPSGQYEVPLAIQDRSFNSDGSIALTSTGVNPDVHPYWDPEYFGDTIMVNGKLWPNMNVEPRQYRFRVLDGSNARFYHLALSNGQSFTQIGSDGGYLPAPVTMNSLLMAPGERADIIVDFSALAPGTQVTMTNDAAAPYPSGTPADPATTGTIMRFTVTGSPAVTPTPLPSTLNTIPTLTPDAPGRILTLNENLSASGGPLELLLNGQPYKGAITETPQVGATEDWQIVNLTGDTHPMHLHLVQYQVVSRQAFNNAQYNTDWQALNGGAPPYSHPTSTLPVGPYLTGPVTPPDTNELGWKDTVKMNPGEITTIRVRFAPQDAVGAAPNINTFPFDPTFGPGYVWHCHIVDHEDNEMMRPLGIVQSGKPAMSLSVENALWASYADYLARTLTVNFHIDNGTAGTARNVQVTGSTATMGVSLLTSVPYAVGDIASSEGSSLSLQYNVPTGVAGFSTSLQVGAKDTAGSSYTYP